MVFTNIPKLVLIKIINYLQIDYDIINNKFSNYNINKIIILTNKTFKNYLLDYYYIKCKLFQKKNYLDIPQWSKKWSYMIYQSFKHSELNVEDSNNNNAFQNKILIYFNSKFIDYNRKLYTKITNSDLNYSYSLFWQTYPNVYLNDKTFIIQLISLLSMSIKYRSFRVTSININMWNKFSFLLNKIFNLKINIPNKNEKILCSYYVYLPDLYYLINKGEGSIIRPTDLKIIIPESFMKNVKLKKEILRNLSFICDKFIGFIEYNNGKCDEYIEDDYRYPIYISKLNILNKYDHL